MPQAVRAVDLSDCTYDNATKATHAQCAHACRGSNRQTRHDCGPCECRSNSPLCEKRFVGKRYFLVVASVFKNEADIIREWVQHHLWQGVDHFYLVDNGSTDDWRGALGSLMQHVTYSRNATLYAQIPHLNTWLPWIRKESRWVLGIDVDEFVYAPPSRGFRNIVRYLRHVEHHACASAMLKLPWLLFGSSGHGRQPLGVREHFTRSATNTSNFGGKYVVRSAAVHELRVHTATLLPRTDRVWRMPQPPPLVLNHYPILSRERFVAVKMTRGDVAAERLLGVRTLQYFERYDRWGSERDNVELKELARQQRLNEDAKRSEAQ